MGSAIALRGEFDGPGLRRLAKAAKDAGQSRRLLALAEIYDGGARSDAARIGDVRLQVIDSPTRRSASLIRQDLIFGRDTWN